MSLNSEISRAGPYTGNSLAKQFYFNFKILQSSDVVVYATDSAGVDSPLTLNNDYTVTMNADQDGSPGGFITMTTPPDAAHQITILRFIAITQGATLTNQGGFYPKVIENALDKLTMIVQQLNEQVGRAYKSSVVSTAIGTIAAYVTQAQNYAASALGYSNSASTSAILASDRSTSASVSATSAANYANAAAIAAQNAVAPAASTLVPLMDSFMNGPAQTTFASMYVSGGWDMGGITGASPFSNENLAARRACLSNGSSTLNFGTVP